MCILERIEMIRMIHKMVLSSSTGTPLKLARRLEISERNLYHYIAVMKDIGAPIYYCIKSESYKYEFHVEFLSGYSYNKNFLSTIRGGFTFFGRHYNFYKLF